MARITILGGGRQGSVVARELAADHEVTVIDSVARSIPDVQNRQSDLGSRDAVRAALEGCDMAVGALPARFGFAAAQAAIDAHKNYVDLAFSEEDAYSLHDAAQAAGVAVLPDCGLAPGISNLVIGRALATAKRQSVRVEVGGVAADKSKPYGYVVTWAVSDLQDEYVRPARIVREGKVIELPPFAELEHIEIPGVGTLESFLTDGCRTLLSIDVPSVEEKTLRWPGHAAAIQPLVAQGTFVEEISSKCTQGDDLVVLRITIDDQVILLIDRPQAGLSAMSRTTALTCASFAAWVATGKLKETGVLAPETIGRDSQAYEFILNRLAAHGVKLQPDRPFA